MKFVLTILLLTFSSFSETETVNPVAWCDEDLYIEVQTKHDIFEELQDKHDVNHINRKADLTHVLYLIERAEYYGIPERIAVRLVYRESWFDSVATSPVGAFGYCQIMPSTWNEISCKLNISHSSNNNIEAGMYYLKEQYDRFKRWDLALAAYNSGPFRKCLHQGRIPRIKETQDYVKYILQ